MSKAETLRALVNERLAAAAEDIIVLFERTIAEYEEELCRCKEENLRIELVRGNVQIPSTSPGPGLNQEIAETPQIKEEPEEQSIKQEEEQLPVSAPESSGVCVKTEESSLLEQRQSEQETEGEDIDSDPHFYSDTEGDTEHSSDTDWEPPFSCPAAQMETEVDGDHYNQVYTRDRGTELSPQNKSAPETTVHNEDLSGAEEKQHQCPFCEKRFTTRPILKRHIRIHAGHKPFSCSICKKSFAQNWVLDKHVRTHTGEKPYCCPVCKRTFTQKGHLERHVRAHSGEKAFGCTVCKKTFAQKGNLERHIRMHTGAKPYSCPVCNKAFSDRSNLNSHMKRPHKGQTST